MELDAFLGSSSVKDCETFYDAPRYLKKEMMSSGRITDKEEEIAPHFGPL